MRTTNLKQIKNIKEILKFLNNSFPSKHYPKFRAFLPPIDSEEDFPCWHITTDDWLLYNGSSSSQDAQDLRDCIEAIRVKFKFKIIFCYLYYVSGNIKFKKGKYILL